MSLPLLLLLGMKVVRAARDIAIRIVILVVMMLMLLVNALLDALLARARPSPEPLPRERREGVRVRRRERHLVAACVKQRAPLLQLMDATRGVIRLSRADAVAKGEPSRDGGDRCDDG